MTAYLITTGSLFGLIALAHFFRTFAEYSRLSTNPGFLLEGPGLGLIAGALSFWAWRVFRGLGSDR